MSNRRSLFDMSDKELKDAYLDRISTVVNTGDRYLDELNRRAQERQARWMRIATGAIAVATVVHAVVAIVVLTVK